MAERRPRNVELRLNIPDDRALGIALNHLSQDSEPHRAAERRELLGVAIELGQPTGFGFCFAAHPSSLVSSK